MSGFIYQFRPRLITEELRAEQYQLAADRFDTLNRQLEEYLNQLGTPISWTPTLTAVTTDPTLGTGSEQSGFYTHPSRHRVEGWFRIQFGTSGAAAGSGNYGITPPVAVAAHYDQDGSAVDDIIGWVYLFDQSATSGRTIAVWMADGRLLAAPGSVVRDASPFTWTNQDGLYGTFGYFVDAPT